MDKPPAWRIHGAIALMENRNYFSLANIFAATNVIIWGWYVYSGLELRRSVSSRHVPGYPNFDQDLFYTIFPSTILIIALISRAFYMMRREEKNGWGLQVLFFFFAIPYALLHTGGM